MYLRPRPSSLFTSMGLHSTSQSAYYKFSHITIKVHTFCSSEMLEKWPLGGVKKERKPKKRNPKEVKIPFMWQALELNTAFSWLSPLICYIETYFQFWLLFYSWIWTSNRTIQSFKKEKIKGSPGTDALTIGIKFFFFLFVFLRNHLKTLKLTGFLNMWGFKRTKYKGKKAKYLKVKG